MYYNRSRSDYKPPPGEMTILAACSAKSRGLQFPEQHLNQMSHNSEWPVITNNVIFLASLMWMLLDEDSRVCIK